MPRAMLTGATGFVGGALLRKLLSRGWEVRALLRQGSDASHLHDLTRGLELVSGDLSEREALRTAMTGCDVVFHVAARYSLWNPDPGPVYRDNVDGTRNVLEIAGEQGIERIVYTSTVGVLRLPRHGGAADESEIEDIERIQGHYKRSKWFAEQCALAFAARGLPVVIVNPTTPVGPRDVKPTPTGRMILDFLRGKMPAYTNTGLNIVSVDDVAAGHLLAHEKGTPGERYILGSENLSLREIFGLLAEITGTLPPRWCIPRRLLYLLSAISEGLAVVRRRQPRIPYEAARMAQKHMYFDSTRARTELGYSPGGARGALERAVRWFLDEGHLSRKVRGSPSLVQS